MQPDQPYSPNPPSQTPEQNPYDFIMNSGEPAKKSPLGLPSGNSTLQRILIFGGGLVILLVVGILGMSLLSGGSKSNTETLLSLAQNQTEIVRVADSISRDQAVQSESTRILALNTSLSVQSSKQQVVAIIAASGKKVNEKQLGLANDPKSDAALKTAVGNNQYDEVASQILLEKLKNYRVQLKNSLSAVTTPKDKQVISDAFKGTGLLLGTIATEN